MEEGHDRAVFFGQRVDRVAQPLGFVECDCLLLRTRPRIGPVGKFFVTITFAPVQTVAAGVVGDCKDPGAELCAYLKGSQAAESLEERLLGDVARILDVVKGAIRQMVDRAVVALYERSECLRVSPERHRHQLTVLRAGLHAAGDRGLRERDHARRTRGRSWMFRSRRPPAARNMSGARA